MHNSVSDISSEMSFEEKLITAIQNHTCLYNKQSLSYRKKSIKRNAWYKVAEDVGTDVNECRHRWRSLRDRYVREVRSKSKNCKWKYMSLLSFLNPQLNSRSYDNSSITITDDDDDDDDDVGSCSNNSGLNTTIAHEENKTYPKEECSETPISKLDEEKVVVDLEEPTQVVIEDSDVEIDEISSSNPMAFVQFINDEKKSRTDSVDLDERFEVNHPEINNPIRSRNENYYKTLDSYMLQLPLNVQDDLKIEILNRVYCEVKSLKPF
ncbi:uncharacterized protein LOC129951147 isoform X2 [Eupeodes corollae]|uniref:uncharacterized protein LOC129951147 isoform X2 n=1 Tax=Eupeodes corollae TaxID=290404 RepID=UPI002492AD9F|nr:uncharacterized protein LOC129951147 isoform X2 [Eupeodes corollae]